MIQLRPSDVMFKLADVLRGASKAAGGISRDLYEADRVSQVNRQLAYVERSYQEYNQNLSKQSFDSMVETGADDQELLKNFGAKIPGRKYVKKSFGEASLVDIKNNEDKFFQAQLEYITSTTTNKAAREEMIQHLTMKNIQNQAIITKQWNVAADHEATAGLNKLVGTVLASNDPWEMKVEKIKGRVREMVAAGRMWKDEGEAVIAQAEAAAQYSFASKGAMDAMKAARDSGAGEAWLKENTPFYDGNPDAREQLLNDVRAEYNYFANAQDDNLERGFVDLWADIDSLEKSEMGLVAAKDSGFYDGRRKVWTVDLFEKQVEYYKEGLDVPPGTGEDRLKASEDVTWGWLVTARENDVPRGEITDYLAEQLRNRNIGGKVYKEMVAYVDELRSPALAGALELIKADKTLNNDERYILKNFMRVWVKSHPSATEKDIENVVRNKIKPIAQAKFDGWFKTFAGPKPGTRRDLRTLSTAEQTTTDINGDKLIGLVHDRPAWFASYNALMLLVTQDRYPGLEMRSVYTDDMGEVSGHAGAAILVDGDNQHFAYKVEDKQLVLYKRTKTDTGAYEWVAIEQPNVTEAKKQAVIDKEEAVIKTAEKAVADEEKAIKRSALEKDAQGFYAVPPGESVLVRADWQRDLDGRWWNNKSDYYTTDADLIRRLNAGEFNE